MKIEAVIFDLDGTLLNTLDDLAAACNHALNAVGRSEIRAADVRRFVGNGVGKLIERALEATGGERGLFDECLARFTEYYDAHSTDKTALYDGVSAMLQNVSEHGIKTAVVTNKYDGAAQELGAVFFKTVNAIVGTQPGIRPKPAPDGVNKALGIIGADVAHSVYVGDGETDIATARACGMPVIAVTWGFRDRDVIEALCPDAIIDSPRELFAALDRI